MNPDPAISHIHVKVQLLVHHLLIFTPPLSQQKKKKKFEVWSLKYSFVSVSFGNFFTFELLFGLEMRSDQMAVVNLNPNSSKHPLSFEPC